MQRLVIETSLVTGRGPWGGLGGHFDNSSAADTPVYRQALLCGSAPVLAKGAYILEGFCGGTSAWKGVGGWEHS